MDFYTEPAFFAAVAVLAVPAVVAGACGRKICRYGCVVSVLMLLAMFAGDAEGLACFACFLVLSGTLFLLTRRWFSRGDAHAVGKYRVALGLQLAPLACAKVSAVFDANLLGFLGISYLTFKAVQVLVETRDGLGMEMSLFEYLSFLVFFPVFTSGPIMRSRDFLSQTRAALSRGDYLDLLARGVLLFAWGAAYTFALSPLLAWLLWFAPGEAPALPVAGAAASQILQALCYGLRLFFDFAGYSLMAAGTGAVFGIRVPRNFKAPFRSIDIKDFWNRWHITLSFWLRDYVFMRLTRALVRRRVFSSRVSTACVGYVCNMLLMGTWHGLTVDYLLYGLFHGVLLAVCELWQKKSRFHKRHKDGRAYRCASWAVTMAAVFFGFALFSGQVTGAVTGGAW